MKKFFLILLVLVSIMLLGCEAEGAHRGSNEATSVNQSETGEQNLIDIDKIDFKGMTYGEVKQIMGSEGTDVGSGAIIFQWKLDDGKVLNVWLGSRDIHDTLDEYYVISFTLEKKTME